MTRKHYQAIVDSINSAILQSENNWSDKERNAVFDFLNVLVYENFIAEFKADNKNFDIRKFISALNNEISN